MKNHTKVFVAFPQYLFFSVSVIMLVQHMLIAMFYYFNFFSPFRLCPIFVVQLLLSNLNLVGLLDLVKLSRKSEELKSVSAVALWPG